MDDERGFVNCVYTEFEPDTYGGFSLSVDDVIVKLFDTRNPIVDYLELLLYATKQEIVLQFSSDVDHFVYDSEDYDWYNVDIICAA